jgi:GNAT superfamily N-acetyltransferase
MCDHWMPTIQVPMTIEQFHQLPRHPAFKYEYVAGQTWLTPRTKHYHAMLDLRPLDVTTDLALRPIGPNDFPELVRLFSAAFHVIQPYGSLDEPTRLRAAAEALERARSGGDGPWIERASFVVFQDRKPAGAIFITLLPLGDPCDWDSYHWAEPPPADAIVRRLGRPHLTWIFVSPLGAGQGMGTALLAAASRELLRLGYTELLSTFMLGNDSSMLWHWRNGFRLLAYPGSARRVRQRQRSGRS